MIEKIQKSFAELYDKGSEEKATCDNCINKCTDVCENENAKKYGFCGNYNRRSSEAE